MGDSPGQFRERFIFFVEMPTNLSHERTIFFFGGGWLLYFILRMKS